MADDKAARDAKADALWSEVAPESTDVKALIDSVSAALKAKQERNKRTSAKAARKANKVAKATKAAVMAQPVIDPSKAQAAEQDLAALERELMGVLYAPSTVTPLTLRDLVATQARVVVSTRNVFGNAQDARLKSIDESIESVKTILAANQAETKRLESIRRAALRRAIVRGAVAQVGASLKTLSSGASKAKDILAKKSSDALAYVSRDRQPQGNLSPAPMPSQAPAPVLATPEQATQPSVGAKSLKEIAKNTKQTGLTVQKASTDSLKWIGKHLKNLSSGLFRFLRAPIRAAGGGLEGLLGVAALSTMFLKPMLEGVHAELKRQFGDDYVESFIKGLWDKSWGFLVSQVKSFLGIKNEEDRAAEYARDAANAAEVKLAASRAYSANPTPENKRALEQATTGAARTNLAATVSNQDTRSNIVTVLNAKLDLYRSLKGVKKTQSKTNIQNMLDDQVTTGTLPKDLADNLKREGFKVAPEKVVTLPAANTTPTSPATGSTPVSAATPSLSNSAPVSATPPPATVVGTSSSMTAPMEESGPVTAKAAPSANELAENGTGYSGKSVSGATPGAAQIPTYINGDAMLLYNSGILAG